MGLYIALVRYLETFPRTSSLSFSGTFLTYLGFHEIGTMHVTPGPGELSWPTLQKTGRALTSCSDGTHLRGDGDPRRPASAYVTTALHLGYGLW